MRILVVDDHPLMADALRLALLSLEDGASVESCADLEAAFAQLSSGLKFGLCLLDLGLPDCSGVEALERMRARFPQVPVVVVSAQDDHASIVAALDRGAMGYIPKNSSRDVLLGAIRLVAAGGIYVPPEAMRPRGGGTIPAAFAFGAMPKSLDQLGLSVRQLEVLDLLLKGMPNKMIAQELQISENTAKVHVSAVLRVLGASTRTQALVVASRLGLKVQT